MTDQNIKPRHSRIPLLPGIVIAGIILFVLINQWVLIPKTALFRPQSTIPNIPAMVHTQVVFGDTIELLGYDLYTPVLAPGDRFHIRLYWALIKHTEQSLSGDVTLTSLDRSQVLGRGQSFNVGNAQGTRVWPVGTVYVQDEYVFPVDRNASPFIATVQISVFVQGSSPLDYLLLPNGDGNDPLTTIHLSGDFKTLADSQIQPLSVDFSGAVTLGGYHLSEDPSGKTCLVLRWQPHGMIPDVQVMIHFIDSSGATIGVADAPPFNGQYPSSAWQPGQTLDDTHCFIATPGTVSLAIALYTLPSGQRLSAVDSNGQPLKDNSYIIPNKAV